MARSSGQSPRLAAIDDHTSARQPVTLDATQRYDPAMEERWLRLQFRRERASAYWFAAAKWGLLGLVIGICLGMFMMHTANETILPTAVNAVAQGAAIEAARDAAQGDLSRPEPTP